MPVALVIYHQVFNCIKLTNKSQAFSLKDAEKCIAAAQTTDARDTKNLPWHLWEEASSFNQMLFHSSHYLLGPNAPLVHALKVVADFFCNKNDSFNFYPYWQEEETELRIKVLEGIKPKKCTLWAEL